MTDPIFKKALDQVSPEVSIKVEKMMNEIDSQYTDFYFLMVDGHCCKISARTKQEAMDLASTQLGYDDDTEEFGINCFLDDLNLIEWKDPLKRYVQDYTKTKYSVETFPAETPYQLEGFLKIRKTKKPTKHLRDEWEEDLV